MKRDNDPENECPTEDFLSGEPSGKCWGDGHYECGNCINYRADFKNNGQDYIDFVHQFQTKNIFITTL